MDAGTTVYIKGGMTVVIEAGLELSLKASGGFIDIGPAGVAIGKRGVNHPSWNADRSRRGGRRLGQRDEQLGVQTRRRAMDEAILLFVWQDVR
jgi:hypothetical protein